MTIDDRLSFLYAMTTDEWRRNTTDGLSQHYRRLQFVAAARRSKHWPCPPDAASLEFSEEMARRWGLAEVEIESQISRLAADEQRTEELAARYDAQLAEERDLLEYEYASGLITDDEYVDASNDLSSEESA